MIDTDKQNKNFQQILLAIENFREQDRSRSGMIYTDNWYDSHPRLLIFDPILTPYDKLIWMAIRTFCSPELSLAAFPSYDDIQSYLHVSRATVSSSIAKLRVTRWITLVCRERVRHANGQFARDGNIYLVHGEPLGLADTIDIDANYMSFLNDCRQHRNSDTRKISEMILSSINYEIDQGRNIMQEEHHFDRRKRTWDSMKNFSSDSVTTVADIPQQPDDGHDRRSGNFPKRQTNPTEVHSVNRGSSESEVHSVNRGQSSSELRC